MVVTLKDGSVVTIFEITEAKEIIGEELYNFIVENNNEYKDKIHELEVKLDDLESENSFFEETLKSIYDQADDIEEFAEELKDCKISDLIDKINEIKDTAKEIKESCE